MILCLHLITIYLKYVPKVFFFLILIYLRLYRVVWRLYKMEKFKAVGDPSVRENESHFTYIITVHGHHLTHRLSASVYNDARVISVRGTPRMGHKTYFFCTPGKIIILSCSVYYYTEVRITRHKPRTPPDKDVWRDGVKMVN